MLEFKPITTEDKAVCEQYLTDGNERGCELSFTNLYLWGDQRIAIYKDHMLIFSRYKQYKLYPYPLGKGDKKPVLDAILADAEEKGIPLRITGLYGDAKETLETLYPGQFEFHTDRDSYDYVYDINNLADLKGKKYHKKKNHYNRFCKTYPDYTVKPISKENISQVRGMLATWFRDRLDENPENDYKMEQIALEKALTHYHELGLEGLVLLNEGEVLGFTIGSRISKDTFDVNFEKARWDVNGAYTAITSEFAWYIRDKYPEVRFLDREEDMGLEGLRKAKLSYHPHHMIEKSYACRVK